jgi:methionyl-tRNA formyltransferase
MAAIDWHNDASLQSGKRLGYRSVGYSIHWPVLDKPLSKLYSLRYASPKEHQDFPLPKIAIITPFHSAVLESVFSSTALTLVVDCSHGQPSHFSLKKQFKRLLYRITGRDWSLKEWAKRRDIPCVKYSPKHKNPTEECVKDQKIELLISYAAPLLPESLFAIPRLGTVNLHPSKLPDYRGGRPLFWQRFLGETEGGVTLHSVNAGIDKGDIIAQRSMDLSSAKQRDALSHKARNESAKLILEFIWTDLIRMRISKTPQIQKSHTRYANQVTLNQLLEEFPLKDMSTEQLMRVYEYLGYWPVQFGELLGFKRWLPVSYVGYKSEVKSFEEEIRKPTRLIRHDGYIDLRVSLKPRKVFSHIIKTFRNRNKPAPDIYL